MCRIHVCGFVARDIWDHGRCGERLAGASGDADLSREAPGGTKGAKGTEKEPPYLPSSYRLLLAGTGRRGSGVELSSAAWDVCTYIYYQPLGPDYIHTSLNEACHSRWRQRRIGDHQECDNLHRDRACLTLIHKSSRLMPATRTPFPICSFFCKPVSQQITG